MRIETPCSKTLYNIHHGLVTEQHIQLSKYFVWQVSFISGLEKKSINGACFTLRGRGFQRAELLRRKLAFQVFQAAILNSWDIDLPNRPWWYIFWYQSCQILWSMAIKCLVGGEQNFVTDPILHRKPVQFSQHYMVKLAPWGQLTRTLEKKLEWNPNQITSIFIINVFQNIICKIYATFCLCQKVILFYKRWNSVWQKIF